MNERDMLALVDTVTDWDDWDRVQQRFFGPDGLRESTLDEVEDDLGRPDVVIDGITWHSLSPPYRPLPLFRLYEKCRDLVFARLEPEAEAENRRHPQRYGLDCMICRMWTRSHAVEACPICGEELLWLCLNED